MSDTPRTDAVPHNVADLAMHARKLERENNELRKDKERLDWVLSHEGRYWLSFREDIDRETEEAQ